MRREKFIKRNKKIKKKPKKKKKKKKLTADVVDRSTSHGSKIP